MCFGSKDARDLGDVPPRPVPLASGSDINKTSSHRPQPQDEFFSPPPGPPPSHASSSRPPAAAVAMSNSGGDDQDYAPPHGAPPSYNRGNAPAADEMYAPPPGPPPSHGQQAQQQQQQQHDWQTAVPDTALLPPPPDLFSGWDRSPANNATEEQSEAGESWCRQFPLNFPPMDLRDNGATKEAIKYYNINLNRPPGYQGKLARSADGSWTGDTSRNSPDSCIIGFPPLYAPSLHSPLDASRQGKPFTAYYEVHIGSHSRSEVSLAMGFTAMPYPAFRLPGWHRGSLAVHGDDGHRYINDTWGGKTMQDGFAFKPGTTYGIGMRFTQDPEATNGLGVMVLFTRNGKLFDSWEIHEETDAEQDRPVVGLEGFHDLSVAIGTFEAVKFDVHLHPSQWLYEELKVEKLAELR